MFEHHEQNESYRRNGRFDSIASFTTPYSFRYTSITTSCTEIFSVILYFPLLKTGKFLQRFVLAAGRDSPQTYPACGMPSRRGEISSVTTTVIYVGYVRLVKTCVTARPSVNIERQLPVGPATVLSRKPINTYSNVTGPSIEYPINTSDGGERGQHMDTYLHLRIWENNAILGFL